MDINTAGEKINVFIKNTKRYSSGCRLHDLCDGLCRRRRGSGRIDARCESLASIRDSIAISVLHITNSPTISGSVIEAKSFGEGSSVRFDFAKNEICNVSTSQKGKEVKSCWPMGTLSAHNRERLRDVSCAHAEAAPAADFTAKYCR